LAKKTSFGASDILEIDKLWRTLVLPITISEQSNFSKQHNQIAKQELIAARANGAITIIIFDLI